MLAAEGRGSQHFVRGINMHIVLLRKHIEILQTLDNGILRCGDVDAVRNDIPGMRNPLPAGHELIFRIVAERIAHATMPPGDIGSIQNRVAQTPTAPR
jgi:hypothetical protein